MGDGEEDELVRDSDEGREAEVLVVQNLDRHNERVLSQQAASLL